MNEKRELHIDINRLWQEYQQHRRTETRERIVEYYLSLVKLVAGRIAIGLPSYVDKEDLISNGFFGLLDAIERFDPGRGIKFETYAVARIRGAILDSLRALDWVPTTVRQKARQYEQVLSELEHKLGRSATDEEIAEAIGISVAQLHTLLNQLNASTIMPLEEFIKTESPSKQIITPMYNHETNRSPYFPTTH